MHTTPELTIYPRPDGRFHLIDPIGEPIDGPIFETETEAEVALLELGRKEH